MSSDPSSSAPPSYESQEVYPKLSDTLGPPPSYSETRINIPSGHQTPPPILKRLKKNRTCLIFTAIALFAFSAILIFVLCTNLNHPNSNSNSNSTSSPSSCSSETSGNLLLFGYSNDLDANFVQDAKNRLNGKLDGYKVFVDVRLDSGAPKLFNLHFDTQSFLKSVDNNLPVQKSPTNDNNNESDVTSMLSELIASNSPESICGAHIVLITNSAQNPDDDELMDLLQLHHMTLL